MARTIRTNSASGGVVSSAAGLSTSEVQALIDTTVNSKVQWQLESYNEYPSLSGSGLQPLLTDIDFENVYAYHVTIKGFTINSSATRLRCVLQKDGNAISGSSEHTYSGIYSTSLQGSNTSFSSGNWYPSNPNQNDSYSYGTNLKEFTFYFNTDVGSNSSRRFECEYLTFIPFPGGYQSYSHHIRHTINASAEFDAISFDMAGNNWQTNTGISYATPSVTVYKQLRVPAN